MVKDFHENLSVQPIEYGPSDHIRESDIPSMETIETRLNEFFSVPAFDTADNQPDIPDSNSFGEKNPRTVTLSDGTVVTLPDMTNVKQDADSSDIQGATETSKGDVKETRELAEDEKKYLKETLGWSDKQISKCTIDEDGVIHYKTDREDMEGKTGENGITYERKTVDIHEIKVQGVFPVFESVCDVQLPEHLEQASNARQFNECNKQLKEKVDNDPELRASFTDEQLEDIEDGDTPSGYVWHHNEETGKMQLVKVEDHDRTQGGAAHTGGKALWGGSYSDHGSSSKESADNQSIVNKEVE